MDGHPGSVLEEVAAAFAHHNADGVVFRSGAHRGQRRQAAQADDEVGVPDEVVHDDLQPVVGHGAAPFGGQVRLVVGLEVAHAVINQAPHGLGLSPRQMSRVGPLAEHAHHGHDVGGQQPLAQLQRATAAVVHHLHPLDLHGLQFVHPEIQFRSGGVIDTARPVHAAAVVILGTGEILNTHHVGLLGCDTETR